MEGGCAFWTLPPPSLNDPAVNPRAAGPTIRFPMRETRKRINVFRNSALIADIRVLYCVFDVSVNIQKSRPPWLLPLKLRAQIFSRVRPLKADLSVRISLVSPSSVGNCVIVRRGRPGKWRPVGRGDRQKKLPPSVAPYSREKSPSGPSIKLPHHIRSTMAQYRSTPFEMGA